MSGFYVTTSKIQNREKTNKYLQYRGRDRQIHSEIGKISFLYNISLQSEENEIYYGNEYYIIFFDGVIFNSEKKTFSETSKFLLTLYDKYGENFTRMLDGEYAICLVDFVKNIVIFATDVFGTKPLWFSEQKGVSISSYKSALIENKKKYTRAKPNTTYVVDLQGNHIKCFNMFKFDLNQHKNTYDDWCQSFEKAIEKRLSGWKKVGLGVSSGFDSGAIYCAIRKKTSQFISVSFPGKESLDILEKRIALHPYAYLRSYEEKEFLVTMKELLRKCEPINEKYFELLKDEASVGLGIICKLLKREKIDIYFSGCGPEGIMLREWNLDGNKLCKLNMDMFGGEFPENLSDIFPWRNFWGGIQALYLEREEYVCGCYGVCATYPFLDTNVVQEFLWLSAELKNQGYKAPIEAYFKMNEFPYRAEKAGFFVRNN